MSKYNTLREFVAAHHGEFTVDIAALDRVVPGGLAPSAATWDLWWNNNDPSHPQSKSWGDPGYDAVPDIPRGRVTFKPAG